MTAEFRGPYLPATDITPHRRCNALRFDGQPCAGLAKLNGKCKVHQDGRAPTTITCAGCAAIVRVPPSLSGQQWCSKACEVATKAARKQEAAMGAMP